MCQYACDYYGLILSYFIEGVAAAPDDHEGGEAIPVPHGNN